MCLIKTKEFIPDKNKKMEDFIPHVIKITFSISGTNHLHCDSDDDEEFNEVKEIVKQERNNVFNIPYRLFVNNALPRNSETLKYFKKYFAIEMPNYKCNRCILKKEVLKIECYSYTKERIEEILEIQKKLKNLEEQHELLKSNLEKEKIKAMNKFEIEYSEISKKYSADYKELMSLMNKESL